MLEDFGPATFGQLNAEDYDALHDPGTTKEAVAFIAGLVGTGTVLELAIGTGRIALPLAERGARVSGIEGSPEMVAKLREKPGGQDIPVTIGDFADLEVDGTFDHALLVFNTFFNLLSQEAQVCCFRNVAKRLNPGGTFLVETFVPDLSWFKDGQTVRIKNLTDSGVWLDAGQHDPVRQRLDFQRVRITEDGIKLVPLPLRYAWPPEMDLMATLAGLRLKNRWGGWHQEPFTGTSKMHVSLYEKPA